MKNLITSSNLTFTKKNCNCGIITSHVLDTQPKLTRTRHKLSKKSHKSKSKNNNKSNKKRK